MCPLATGPFRIVSASVFISIMPHFKRLTAADDYALRRSGNMCENAHAALSRDAKFVLQQHDQLQGGISAPTSRQP